MKPNGQNITRGSIIHLLSQPTRLQSFRADRVFYQLLWISGKVRHAVAFVIIVIMAGLLSSHAQDHPCNPNVLSFGINGPFNTSTATIDEGEATSPAGDCSISGFWCDNAISNTLWFSFVAPASGNVTLQSPGFDTQIALWKVTDCSNYATFVLVDANDDDANFDIHGGEEFSSFMGPYTCAQQLTPGAKYYVQLDPYESPGSSTTIVLTDAGTPSGSATYYSDNDADGYGDISSSLFSTDCIVPNGYVQDSTDCNDNNSAVHPQACDNINGNGVDDNCDGIIDNGYGAILYYADADGDDYGAGNAMSLCTDPGAGYSTNNADCNDDPDQAGYSIHPDAKEFINAIDDNCDSFVDNDIWIQKNDLGYNAANVAEPSARSGAVGFSIGSKGYIGTGGADDFWEYDPILNSWTQKADFGGTARSSAVGFSIGTKGYLGTGSTDTGPQKDFWEYDPELNTWVQKSDFGGAARYGAVGFSMGGKGYLGTGSAASGLQRDFWEYDPGLNTWVRKANFGGTARYGAVGFSIGAMGYIGTGNENNYKKDFWEYDPIANTWTKKSDFGGNAKTGAIGFSIENKGYIGTGIEDYGYGTTVTTTDFWEYDPDLDTWTSKTFLGGGGRVGATGFSIGNQGYLGTGFTSSSFGGPFFAYSDFWMFDATANTWTRKADFGGNARSSAVAFHIGRKGYIGTGSEQLYVYKKDFWEFDPEANTWTQKADFGGSARSNAIGFSIGNKGYIGTGRNCCSSYKDFWEYNPETNTWIQKADFAGSGRYDAVGFSIDDKGYIGTGYSSPAYKRDFWEYDPDTNTWSQKADFGGSARSNAAGFSSGSYGFIGTGYDGTSKKDFWEYDPNVNTWTKKADFGGSARYDAAGLSIGSGGYIGTGYDGVNKNDFWEYDQEVDSWTQKADFGGIPRTGAVGFSIGSNGYMGTGSGTKDLWEYRSEGTGSTCKIPAGLTSINISSSTAKLKWDYISSVIGYKVRYKIAGTSEWTKIQSIDNYKTLNELSPNTEYAWQVKSICGVHPIDASEWSEKQFFTTGDLRLSESTIGETSLEVYPNPVSQSATVSFFLPEALSVFIELKDVNGRSLKVIADADFSEGNHEVTFNRESLIAGIYFLQIKTYEGVLMKKIIMD